MLQQNIKELSGADKASLKQAQQALLKLSKMNAGEVQELVARACAVWHELGTRAHRTAEDDTERELELGLQAAAVGMLMDVFCFAAGELVEGYESPASWDDDPDY